VARTQQDVPPQGRFELDAPFCIDLEAFDRNAQAAERKFEPLQLPASLLPGLECSLVFMSAGLVNGSFSGDGVLE